MSSILFADTGGLYLPFAQRLTKEFDTVYYYNEWESNMGNLLAANYVMGKGIKGIEKVDSIVDAKDKADVIFYPDCTKAAEQMDLKAQGYKVFGTGSANVLENDRFLLMNLIEDEGLPSVPHQVVKTVDELLEVLENSSGDKYIKINRFRMNMETYRHWSIEASRIHFERLKLTIGTYQDQIRFIIEDPVKGEEVGIDTYCINGELPETVQSGYELKDKGYVGRMIKYSKLPEGMKDNVELEAKFLGEHGVSCFFSDEERVAKKKFHLTDFTARLPCPVNETYQVNYNNLGEIIRKGADGILVEPDYKKEYCAQILISSNVTREDFTFVRIPPELEDNIRLYRYTIQDGKHYIIPSVDPYNEVIGSVVGTGKTVDEAIEQCLDYASQVEADGLYYNKHEFIDAIKTIEEGAEAGITVFD